MEDTDRSQCVQGFFVARINSVEAETDDDLLPGRASLIPELRFLEIADVANVLHNSVQCPCREDLVLALIGDRDQEFGMPIVHHRSEVVAISHNEFVRVAGGSGVCSVSRRYGNEILRPVAETHNVAG